VLATETHQPVYIGLSASVSGHIWTGLESVNAFLQFYFKGAKTPGNLGFRARSKPASVRIPGQSGNVSSHDPA
jgi:hypothetical protein